MNLKHNILIALVVVVVKANIHEQGYVLCVHNFFLHTGFWMPLVS
jgi:hypothetical protein